MGKKIFDITEKFSKILKCPVLSSFHLSILKAPIKMVGSVSKSWVDSFLLTKEQARVTYHEHHL